VSRRSEYTERAIDQRFEWQEEEEEESKSKFVVDILSIGSEYALDCSRRNAIALPLILPSATFFNATELDDMDQASHSNLTKEDAYAIAQRCHRKKGEKVAANQYIMKYIARDFIKPELLAQKLNPVGWLCAQPRFVLGLHKALQSYKCTGQSFPRQFITMDADTYFDMEQFQTAFEFIHGG
jgi:hypothetical protein